MSFNVRDQVISKSYPDQIMIVEAQAFREYPPTNIYNEYLNVSQSPDGSYYCSWKKKGKDYGSFFTDSELELVKYNIGE